MAGRMLPGELTWPKLLGTSIAAVVAAWLAGYLGLGNTLTGVAIGSIFATFGTAFFTTTIDKSHQAVIVRTDRGTVIEDAGSTRVLPAQTDESDPMSATSTSAWTTGTASTAAGDGSSRWSRIHWKAVAIASLLTMAITLGAISIYESAVGRTWGSNEPGTSIGNTVRGGPAPTITPAPTPTPSEEPTETPSPSEEPSASATPTEASPTPTPTNTDCPTPTPSPNAAAPGPTSTDCPTPTPSASQDGGLLR